jgi:hypothetical protein
MESSLNKIWSNYNIIMIKKLDLQNSTCFYVFKLNIDPFISKWHILLISKPIWMIFATLDALGGELLKTKFKL